MSVEESFKWKLLVLILKNNKINFTALTLVLPCWRGCSLCSKVHQTKGSCLMKFKRLPYLSKRVYIGLHIDDGSHLTTGNVSGCAIDIIFVQWISVKNDSFIAECNDMYWKIQVFPLTINLMNCRSWKGPLLWRTMWADRWPLLRRILLLIEERYKQAIALDDLLHNGMRSALSASTTTLPPVDPEQPNPQMTCREIHTLRSANDSLQNCVDNLQRMVYFSFKFIIQSLLWWVLLAYIKIWNMHEMRLQFEFLRDRCSGYRLGRGSGE